MATHSSILAWKVPRTELSGRLQCKKENMIEHSTAQSGYACVSYQESELLLFLWWFLICVFSSQLGRYSHSPGNHKCLKLLNCYTFSLPCLLLSTSKQCIYQSIFNCIKKCDFPFRFVNLVFFYCHHMMLTQQSVEQSLLWRHQVYLFCSEINSSLSIN